MKLKALSTFALLPAMAFFGACDDQAEPETVTVYIESSDWNGWDENHVPTVTVVSAELEVGESLRADRTFMGPFDITVDSIDDNSITLSLSQEMAPQGEGTGFDMYNPVDSITVSDGETVVVLTPSFDAGYSHDIWFEYSN